MLQENASQADVFHAAVQPIVDDVMNGYNGTIMAYGQTGAGKTYTLSSVAPDNIGMMPRAAAAIFSEIEHDSSNSYTVVMSYIQIYMELLQVRQSLWFGRSQLYLASVRCAGDLNPKKCHCAVKMGLPDDLWNGQIQAGTRPTSVILRLCIAGLAAAAEQ